MDEVNREVNRGGKPGTEAHVTEQEVSRYVDEVWGDKPCSVCGKRPDQIEALVTKNDVRLCDSCIEEFHQMLHEDS